MLFSSKDFFSTFLLSHVSQLINYSFSIFCGERKGSPKFHPAFTGYRDGNLIR
ncbi:hypothetical protein EVA_14331 [gut metagenome]|uniref:Uncharacterized protein n=1 Tax=gut metagenome TaxID=749906 RepID=J9FRL0_9ZZZZ